MVKNFIVNIYVLHLSYKIGINMSVKNKMGRRGIYGGETVMVSFRCPVSKVGEFRDKCYGVLYDYRVLPEVEVVEEDLGHCRAGSVSVSGLPDNRVLITTGGYLGLYSGNRRFYTNKMVDGNLEVLEWREVGKAKKYLDWLKNK
jgi:hypothetical protein